MSGDRPLYDSGVYHAQQAAEKALKAFLTHVGKPFPKTHELSLLLDLVVQVDPALERFREHCLTLSPYASEFRYPGGEFAPAASDAAEALSLADEMLAAFQKLFAPRP